MKDSELPQLLQQGLHYFQVGQLDLAVDSFQEVLRISRHLNNPMVEGVALTVLGNVYLNQNKYQQAIAAQEQALEISKGIGNYAGQGAALGGLGFAYLKQDQYQKGFEYLEQALPIFQQTGDRAGECQVLSGLGNAYTQLEQYSTAINYYHQALAAAEESGNLTGKVTVLSGLADVYLKQSQYQKAIDTLKPAVPIFRDMGNPQWEGEVCVNLGKAYDNLLQYDKAISNYEQALTNFRKSGDQSKEANLLLNLGIARDHLGQYNQSAPLYERALTIFREIGDRQGEGKSFLNLGFNHLYLAQYLEGISFLKQALSIFQDIGDTERQGLTLERLGYTYTGLGKFTEAISFFHQGLEVVQNSCNCLLEGIILSNLGNALTQTGQYQQAVEHLNGALTIAKEINNPVGKATALSGLGDAYVQQGEYQKAVDALQPVISILQEIGDSASADLSVRQLKGATYINLGRAYDVLKQFTEAINSFDDGLKVAQELGNQIEQIIALNSLNFLYLETKDFEKSIESGNQILAIAEETGDYDKILLTETKYNLGTAYLYRIEGEKSQNLEKAIEYLQAALEFYNYQEYPQEWARVKNNLAVAYLYRINGGKSENIEASISHSEETLNVYTKDEYPQEWAKAQLNLGHGYSIRILGEKVLNLEQSIDYYNQALPVFICEGDSHEWAMTQSNLGSAYATYAKQNSAKVGYLQWFKQGKPALTPDNISDFGEQAKQEKIEKAIESFNLALEVLTREDYSSEFIQVQTNLGHTLLNKSEITKSQDEKNNYIDQAISHFNSTLGVFAQDKTTNLPPEQRAEVNNHLAAAYIKKLKNNRGEQVEILNNEIALFQDTLKIYTRDAFPQKYAETKYNLGRAYKYANEFSAAYQAFDEAIQTLDYLRSQITSRLEIQEDKQKLIEAWSHLYQDMVEVCKELNKPIEAIEYIERSKTQSLVELFRNKQSDTNPIPDERITFDDIKKLIDKETAIIEWYILENRVLAFILTHQNPLPIIWESSGENWTKWLESYFTYFLAYQVKKEKENPNTSFPVGFYASLKNKYQHEGKWTEIGSRFDQWQGNLEEKLENVAKALHIDEIFAKIPSICNQLIMVPHRWLHLIPLHALPISEEKNQSQLCLLDKFSKGIRYVPSCQLLKLSQSQVRPNFNDFFAFQNPKNDLYDDLNFADLEVEKICSLFPDPTVVKKQEATKAALHHQAFKNAHCVHFACHGQFNLEFPLKSRLILASDKTDDGNFNLDEIFGLRFNECRLVTLSACETGFVIDLFSNSDEYITLASGFLCAGSPSVVSSLWTVDDLSTAFLMIRFYQNLQTVDFAGIALNQAQLWLRDVTKLELEKWIEANQLLLSSTVKLNLRRRFHKLPNDAQPFQSPFYWAAFCAIEQ